MQTIRMMPCIARFLTAAALMNLFSHLVVSENSIVVRQNLGTFDSFEISDLEKLTNSAKDGVTILQAPGTMSGNGIFTDHKPWFRFTVAAKLTFEFLDTSSLCRSIFRTLYRIEYVDRFAAIPDAETGDTVQASFTGTSSLPTAAPHRGRPSFISCSDGVGAAIA